MNKIIICEETGKICYSEREAGAIVNGAKKYGNRKRMPLRKYYCNFCGCYHTTSEKTKRGKK